MIALYFLLRIVEYTMTSDKKQTQQFRLRDIVLLKKYKVGNLRQLVHKTADKEVIEADGATLILVNSEKWAQKFLH